MKMVSKLLAAGIAACMLVTALAACGGPSTSSTSAPASSTATVSAAAGDTEMATPEQKLQLEDLKTRMQTVVDGFAPYYDQMNDESKKMVDDGKSTITDLEGVLSEFDKGSAETANTIIEGATMQVEAMETGLQEILAQAGE